MRILLVSPKFASGWKPYIMPPIGLCYLKASLTKAGFKDTKVLDASNYSIKRIKREIEIYRPDIIGVTCFTEARHNALDVTRVAKELGATTILGGVHPTFMYKQILDNYKSVDIVVVGEGEETIVELAKSLVRGKWESIGGLVLRYKDQIIVGSERERIEDLDSIPYPDYSDLDLKRYDEFPILTSRGCPFQCVFCSARACWGNWRHRSVPNVVKELGYSVSRYGRKSFIITDDIFSASSKRVEELCQALVDSKLGIKWKIQTRVDSVTLPLLGLMKEAGCTGIVFGVESGSPTILKNLNKKEDIESVVEAFTWCNQVGICSTFNVLIGAPGETVETLNETRELIRRCRPSIVSTAVLRVYPGTPLWAQEEYSDDWLLGGGETLYYTKAMRLNEMYRHSREMRMLQARLNGMKGYLNLIKFGMVSLRRIPSKVFRSIG